MQPIPLLVIFTYEIDYANHLHFFVKNNKSDFTMIGEKPEVDYSTDAALKLAVQQIFKRLDVDCDGKISWWEWQASLSGALLGRHPTEKFIDPMDGLAVIAQAAELALKAQAQISSLAPLSGGGSAVLPDLWCIPYIDPSDASRAPVSVAGGRSVNRFQDEVRSLRLSSDLSAPFGDNRDNALLTAALKKQLEAEVAAEEARLACRAEEKKRVDLQASLETLKKLNENVRGAREDKDKATKLLQDKLKSDVDTHADNLKRIAANKKKRLRASITIALFLKRIVVPRHRQLKAAREKARLGHALLGVFHRKHFLKTMDLRTRATLLLQKRIRGILARKRLDKLRKAAIKVQVIYLFHHCL